MGPGETEHQIRYLIPEFCSMTGLTDKMRADRGIMQDIAVYTRVSPARRVEDATKYLNVMTGSGQQ